MITLSNYIEKIIANLDDDLFLILAIMKNKNCKNKITGISILELLEFKEILVERTQLTKYLDILKVIDGIKEGKLGRKKVYFITEIGEYFLKLKLKRRC